MCQTLMSESYRRRSHLLIMRYPCTLDVLHICALLREKVRLLTKNFDREKVCMYRSCRAKSSPKETGELRVKYRTMVSLQQHPLIQLKASLLLPQKNSHDDTLIAKVTGGQVNP